MMSSTTNFPPAPPLGPLRLAKMADVPRLGLVASAGFYYSEVRPFTRPRHVEYPGDTILSYQKLFATLIADPNLAIVVASGKYDPEESLKTDAGIPKEAETNAKAGEQVIVGVVVWKFPDGSPRKGQFG
jgi:hypothetical protein